MSKPTEIKTETLETKAAVELTVDKDLAEKLKTQLNEKISELSAKENAVATLTATVESLKSEVSKATEMATKIQDELNKEVIARKALETKQAEDAKKAVIASRMEMLSKVIEITDSNKGMFEKECEASDEDFAKKIEFYKSISKKAVASVEVVKVETDIKAEVKAAVAETVKDTKSVSIFVDAPSASLTDKFAKAFSTPQAFGYTDKKLVK